MAVRAQETDSAEEAPRDVGLVEETGRRLLQIDVTVRGPEETLERLTAADFELVVGGRVIEEFLLDSVCVADVPVVVPKIDPLQVEATSVGPPPPPGLVLLFYFDQLHLTAAGRQRALQLSRDLIAELIGGANRAMIVSSGKRVETFAGLTSDRDRLLAALDRLEQDAEHHDPYPNLEDQRVQQLYAALEDSLTAARAGQRIYGRELQDSQGPTTAPTTPLDPTSAKVQAGMAQRRAQNQADEENTRQVAIEHAVMVARQLQQEEKSHTEQALARLSMILGRLAEVDPPKAAIYFADRMRSNPGDHYWNLLDQTDYGPFQYSQGGHKTLRQTTHGANLPAYEDVVNVAAAHGVRLYTVQAEGLVPRVASSAIAGPVLQSSNPLASTVRFRDAENGLAGLALESGGRVFLGAAAAAGRIVEQIRADLTCLYLLSFDPRDLPEDRALSVLVNLARPGLEARYRARLFVNSEAARLRSRLANAFYGADPDRDSGGLRVAVVPTGFASGKFTALVQAAVPGSPLGGVTWEIGLTIISDEKLRGKPSGSISINRPGVPVVFETEAKFDPGPYEITAVARDSGTGQIISRKIEGEWPDPRGDDPVIGPIALLQPTYGAFVRDGEQRTEGSLSRGPNDWISPDLPTALVTIACRGRSGRAGLTVERELEGASVAEFSPIDLSDSKEACNVLLDLVRADTMTSGSFRYGVRVLEGDGEVASGVREFVALTDEEIRLAGQDRPSPAARQD